MTIARGKEAFDPLRESAPEAHDKGEKGSQGLIPTSPHSKGGLIDYESQPHHEEKNARRPGKKKTFLRRCWGKKKKERGGLCPSHEKTMGGLGFFQRKKKSAGIFDSRKGDP